MKTKCWNCGELFEVDVNDLRPYVYHMCEDNGTGKATMHAHSNPNLIRRIPGFTAPSRPTPLPKKDHILREYFGYAAKTIKQDDEDEDEEHDEKGVGVNQWGF